MKILIDPRVELPSLELDSYGFTLRVPGVQRLGDGQFGYLRQSFPANAQGKVKVGRLFRAAVLHLTTHTLLALPREQTTPVGSDSIAAAFAKSLARDVFVNAYLQAWYPDRLVDLAFSNALAYMRVKPAGRIFSSSTRVMTAVLTQLNLGLVKGELGADEKRALEAVMSELSAAREVFLGSLAGVQVDLGALLEAKAKVIVGLLEPFGPFMEVPSLPHTEQVGGCSIYSGVDMPLEEVDGLFVGRAALEADGFVRLVEIAGENYK